MKPGVLRALSGVTSGLAHSKCRGGRRTTTGRVYCLTGGGGTGGPRAGVHHLSSGGHLGSGPHSSAWGVSAPTMVRGRTWHAWGASAPSMIVTGDRRRGIVPDPPASATCRGVEQLIQLFRRSAAPPLTAVGPAHGTEQGGAGPGGGGYHPPSHGLMADGGNIPTPSVIACLDVRPQVAPRTGSMRGVHRSRRV